MLCVSSPHLQPQWYTVFLSSNICLYTCIHSHAVVSPILLVLLITFKFFPLFACMKSPVPLLGHIMGLVYTVFWWVEYIDMLLFSNHLICSACIGPIRIFHSCQVSLNVQDGPGISRFVPCPSRIPVLSQIYIIDLLVYINHAVISSFSSAWAFTTPVYSIME